MHLHILIKIPGLLTTGTSRYSLFRCERATLVQVGASDPNDIPDVSLEQEVLSVEMLEEGLGGGGVHGLLPCASL